MERQDKGFVGQERGGSGFLVGVRGADVGLGMREGMIMGVVLVVVVAYLRNG